MWIMMNNSFLSVVKNINQPDELLVRSRVDGDIQKIFPGAKVVADVGTDYKYRSSIDKEIVSKAIEKEIKNIDYDNFKNSISFEDKKRHDIYFDVWIKLRELQIKTNE